MFFTVKVVPSRELKALRQRTKFGSLKKFNLSLLIIFALACLPIGVNASEISELKDMMKKMEDRHQKEMADMQKKIEGLSKKRQSSGGNTSVDLDAKMDRFEQKMQKTLDAHLAQAQTGFTSPKKWHFDLGGELEFEFVATEDGAGVVKPNAHFQIDQLYLYPKVRYKDMALFSADIAIKTASASIEEAWVQFYGLPVKTYVEAGLNDIFIANIQRKTETEILIESAFYRDDDLGVRIGGKPTSWFYWQAGVTNGFFLAATRSVSEDSSFPIIADRKNTSNTAGRPMLAIAAGFKPDIGALGKIDVLPFYYSGELSAADITFLQAIPGYGPANLDDDKYRYGFNARYDYQDFTVLGQLLVAKDGNLDRTGWFIQPSLVVYENASWRWFNKYEAVYRYSDLDIDLPKVVTNSLTFDREQHVLAMLVTLFPNTTLKLEYNINEEDTGGDSVDNDEFLTQLEVKW